ncbi:MAG: hypothetical protein D3904_09520 [Candidatus Electrothrix sp. EH2]|nr:hypothetical protein [Candidatus Electrothrix sp. EH2]
MPEGRVSWFQLFHSRDAGLNGLPCSKGCYFQDDRRFQAASACVGRDIGNIDEAFDSASFYEFFGLFALNDLIMNNAMRD